MCSTGNGSFLRLKANNHACLKVLTVLRSQGAIASLQEQRRFVEHLERSIRLRQAVAKRWTKNRSLADIIGLIQSARDSGEQDEAIWRCFLAAHFGRASANDSQLASASWFLCGFGDEPYWTWSRTCEGARELQSWLVDHAADLQTLAYGNHRKYESKQPTDIWDVIESFLSLASAQGGPTKLIAQDSKEDDRDTFGVLYRRLKPIRRFGRTARFDFLALLFDLGLIAAEPASCYLRGATGPKKGAEKLWGKRSIGQLDYLAVELADRLRISPMALEDALCNWQR